MDITHARGTNNCAFGIMTTREKERGAVSIYLTSLAREGVEGETELQLKG